MLSIAIEARDEVVLVRLAGELAMETTDRLREAVAPLQYDARPLVLDAPGLAFLDSTGIAALCGLAASRGRPIGVLEPQYVVRNALTLLELATLLPVIERVDGSSLVRLSAPLAQ